MDNQLNFCRDDSVKHSKKQYNAKHADTPDSYTKHNSIFNKNYKKLRLHQVQQRGWEMVRHDQQAPTS